MCEAVSATLSCVLIGSFSGSRNVMFCSTESWWQHLGTPVLQQSILKVEQVQKKNPEVQRICFTVIDSESPELLRESEQAGGVGSPSVSDWNLLMQGWLAHEDWRRFSGWKMKWEQFRWDAHFKWEQLVERVARGWQGFGLQQWYENSTSF